MKSLPLFVTAIILLAPAGIFGQVDPPNDTEFNIWNDVSLTIPLVKESDGDGKEVDKVTLFFFTTLRLGRDNLRPVDERGGVGFNFRINEYVSLSPDVFYRGSQPFAGNSSTATRLRFAVNLQKKWSSVSIVDRNQIEYRFRNNKKDDVRYKNRLRINIPVKKEGRVVLTPFVSTEPYYNITTKKFTRNELMVGTAKKFNNNFGTDFYYVLVNDRSFPKTVHGIGIALKFKIDR